jgi:cellulose synthase operon protein C
MLHDFGAGEETPAVIRKELKIEPEEFDKQFLASVEAQTRKQVDNFDHWRAGIKQISDLAKAKDYDGVIKQGVAIRDLYPDYVEAGSVYEFLANAYIEKNDKTAAVAELERYVKVGGRYPELIKKLGKMLDEAGRKKEAADVLERLNYIYPLDNQAHQELGSLLLEQNDAKDAVREYRAIVGHNPIDPAQSHFDLARAYNSNHQTEQAKDELFSALEAAPGFRPAQKLLLELNAPEKK